MKKALLVFLTVMSAQTIAADKKTFPQNTQRVLPEVSTQLFCQTATLTGWSVNLARQLSLYTVKKSLLKSVLVLTVVHSG